MCELRGRTDIPQETSEFFSTPLTASDISIVPPTPTLEAGDSRIDVSIRIQDDSPKTVDKEVTGFLNLRDPFLQFPYNDNPSQGRDNSEKNHRRKALLIGIKYDGLSCPIEGAHSDVDDMKHFLINTFGWLEEEVSVLKDDESEYQPTRNNIIFEMRQLVSDARPGDRFFLHYSGHGGQIADTDGDESDGLDEVIYSCDKGSIVDDEMHDILVKPLPEGCRLTALFDCCSSGTALDLPVLEFPSFKMPELAHDNNAASDPSPYLARGYSSSRGVKKYTAGDVIMWSSCHDSEHSYEVLDSRDQRMKGAMTHAFIECLNTKKRQTHLELLNGLYETLGLWGCRQHPLMSSARQTNMRDIFSI